MSIEQATQQEQQALPHYPTLSVARRSGFKEFDIEEAGLTEDLLHHVSVELSGGAGAKFLQPANDSTEEYSHDTFEADLTTSPYIFNGLRNTNELLTRVTGFMRSFARLEPDFAERDEAGKLIPHRGLAHWQPSRVQLDRYDIHRAVHSFEPGEFQGDESDRIATVILPLRGQRKTEFESRGSFAQFAALEVGKLAVVRTDGLIADRTDIAPGYRLAAIAGHVALILRNSATERTVPAEITYDRTRERRAEQALGGDVSHPGKRILRSMFNEG